MSTKKQNKRNYRSTRRNRKSVFLGGDLTKHSIFSNIQSIGFEIETTDLIKLTKEPNEKGKMVLVNSALSNADLEAGYFDEHEYTNVIDKKELQFKITNDAVEDTELNQKIESMIDVLGEEDSPAVCEHPLFQLRIPKNPHMDGKTYDILFRDFNNELINCSSFTDTEWIITNYKPERSRNIVLQQFTESLRMVHEHIHNLKPINGVEVLNRTVDSNYVAFDDITNTKQIYVLPETSLVYLNSVICDQNTQYDITKDIKFVVQMTFGCRAIYAYKLMKQLLSLDLPQTKIETLKKYTSDNNKVREIIDTIEQYQKNESFDKEAIEVSFTIMRRILDLFKEHQPELARKIAEKTKANKEAAEKWSCFQTYLFLIIYKLFVYLNSYIENTELSSGNMLKKNLSFVIRHSNYVLYEEMKRKLKDILGTKTEKEVVSIIQQMIKNSDKDAIVRKKLYALTYVRKKYAELYKLLKEHEGDDKMKSKYYGDPLNSLSSYFEHFENPEDDEEEEEEDDEEDKHSDTEGEEEEEEDEEPETNGGDTKAKTKSPKQSLSKAQSLTHKSTIKSLKQSISKAQSLTHKSKTKSPKRSLSKAKSLTHKSKQEEFDELKNAKRDWLVRKSIDEKSTKFDLSDDNIIVEFRDFPTYCYLELFASGSEEQRQELLKLNIGTLNMKIMEPFLKKKNPTL